IDVAEQEDEAELQRLETIAQQYLMDFLSQIDGLSQFSKEALARSENFDTVEKLAEAEPSQLLSFTADDEELAEDIVAGAKEYLENLREMTASSEAVISGEMKEKLANLTALADRLAGKTPSAEVVAGSTDGDSDAADPAELPKPGEAFTAAPEDVADPPPASEVAPEVSEEGKEGGEG